MSPIDEKETIEDAREAGLLCPQCEASNVAQHKFCAKCGAPLWEACFRCGEVCPAGETYCGACGAYLKGRCPGCHANVKATWCKVRTCCIEEQYATCADCTQHADPKSCRKFNNPIAKLFGLIFSSDRRACILQIRAIGLQEHAEQMAAAQLHSIKRSR